MGEKSGRTLSENKALLIAVIVIACILSPLCYMAFRAVDYQLCYVRASEDIDAKIHSNVLYGMKFDEVMKTLKKIAPFKVYETSPNEDGKQSVYVGFRICLFDMVDYQLIFNDEKLEEYRRYNHSE